MIPQRVVSAGLGLMFLLVLGISGALAQTPTVGLTLNEPEAFQGYTLFAPKLSDTTYLIDMYGRLVRKWGSDYNPGASVYLLPNGDLLRTAQITGGGGQAGAFEKYDWDGNLLWYFEYFSQDVLSHHDIEPLPNGNVLVIAREYKTLVEAEAAGKNLADLEADFLTVEHIIEVAQTGPTSGEIVWEWHVWDHLIQDFSLTADNFGEVGDHPELADINYIYNNRPNWLHFNGLDYHPEFDQIIISVHHFGEIWVIDHSTTTEEAAGHSGGNSGMGGDILYRWGNPRTYRAGTVDDQVWFDQHNAQWIGAGLPGEGNIVVFNNGTGRSEGNFSTVDEIVSPADEFGSYPAPPGGQSYGPADLNWSYRADNPEDFYSSKISGAQRLPNGHTLICEGNEGRFFEVTTDGEIVWEYISPINDLGNALPGETPINNQVFRCTRLSPDNSAFDGRDLTVSGPLEVYPISISGTGHVPAEPSELDDVTVTAVIEDDGVVTGADLLVAYDGEYVTQTMFDDGSHGDGAAGDNRYGAIIPAQPEGTRVEYYILAEDDQANVVTDPPAAPAIAYFYATPTCCELRVGDVNGQGGDEPTIGDISVLIDAKFVSQDPAIIACTAEADINQSGGPYPTSDDITIGDISYLIDYLFVSGTSIGLPSCF